MATAINPAFNPVRHTALKAQLRLLLAGLAACCLVAPVQAAELNIAADSDDVVDQMEDILDGTDIDSMDQASTGRFHLLMAQITQGSHVTVTFEPVDVSDAEGNSRQITRVTIRTDSPKDTRLETRLSEALTAAQSSD